MHIPNLAPSWKEKRRAACQIDRCVRNNRRRRPYESKWFAAISITKPYKFIWFGVMHVPKCHKFIGSPATITPAWRRRKTSKTRPWNPQYSPASRPNVRDQSQRARGAKAHVEHNPCRSLLRPCCGRLSIERRNWFWNGHILISAPGPADLQNMN